MTRARLAFLVLASATAATCAVDLLAPEPVQACAIMPRSLAEAPSLAVEQALLLHDPASGTEHFIRQIAFRRSSGSFGFVVPVPSKPEVAKVESPFARLDDSYPFAPPPPRPSSGCFLDKSERATAAVAAPAGVNVLSVQRIGSFTAFVLDASDAAALGTWLGQNHLQTPPGTVPWLAHYTALHFFYVALRFEPPAQDPPAAPDAPDASEVSAEPLRISFASALPYFPYLEPDAPAGSGASSRVLAVWTIAPAAATPVAVRADGSGTHWMRPWLEGAAGATDRLVLGQQLGAELAALLPGKGDDELVVQTFEDQKTSRHGWGDVLLVPRSGDRSGAAAARDKLAPLLDARTAVLP
jgi:hypothetical protein